MNLHEYQSKQLFADYGLPVSPGFACDTPEEVAAKAKEIGGDKWVVKAQVHAGGRGKAGGVKLVDSPEEAAEFAKKWLGQRLVTFQTDEHGQPVTKILVETCTDIARELYLSAVLDRATRRAARSPIRPARSRSSWVWKASRSTSSRKFSWAWRSCSKRRIWR